MQISKPWKALSSWLWLHLFVDNPSALWSATAISRRKRETKSIEALQVRESEAWHLSNNEHCPGNANDCSSFFQFNPIDTCIATNKYKTRNRSLFIGNPFNPLCFKLYQGGLSQKVFARYPMKWLTDDSACLWNVYCAAERAKAYVAR